MAEKWGVTRVSLSFTPRATRAGDLFKVATFRETLLGILA
jgi:hypothetical protein